MRAFHWLLLVGAAIVGLGGGWAVQHWLAEDEESIPDVSQALARESAGILGSERPGFTLPDLDGESVRIDRFDGNVLVINFWATWCPPCVEEVPMLIELHADRYDEGLRVIGVAVEEAEPVREFAEEFGINYPVLVGVRSGFDLVGDYGNPRGTLPYTVFVDRQGTIRGVHHGLLSREQADTHLQSLLGGD